MAKVRLTTEEFICRSKRKYPNLYDYKSTDYIDMKTSVKLTCLIHGEFEQIPHTHLHYGGCFQCKYDKQRLSVEEFIHKSQKIHGNKYNYSLVSYVNNKTSVIIECDVHGSFSQLPLNHLTGTSCPSCAKKPYSKKEINWLTEFDNINIEHAENGGQARLPYTKLKVDGFDRKTKTVYEFYGDAFHGNPNRFNPTDMCHPYDNTLTANELYVKTKNREHKIKKLGYNLITVWESDYDIGVKESGA